MSDLAAHIQHTRLLDTHEHLHGEQRYVEQEPDLLQDLPEQLDPQVAACAWS